MVIAAPFMYMIPPSLSALLLLNMMILRILALVCSKYKAPSSLSAELNLKELLLRVSVPTPMYKVPPFLYMVLLPDFTPPLPRALLLVKILRVIVMLALALHCIHSQLRLSAHYCM